MLYLAPPEFRRKWASPIRAVIGIVVLAIGIALSNWALLIVGVVFIVLALVGWIFCGMNAGSRT